MRKCAELKTHTKILNHQYNLSTIEGNLKNRATQEATLERFDDVSAKRNARADIGTIAFYQNQINSLEFFVKKNAKLDDYHSFMLLKSIKGVEDVLAMTILYEIHTISRFPTVQKFASYCRLIKCKAESAGKIYGTSGNKIGNAHLKWAFSETAALYLRGNEKAQNYHARLVKKHGKRIKPWVFFRINWEGPSISC